LSRSIQRKLFENYNFLNLSGKTKNLLSIFRDSSEGKPPAASGECAAPKLLQYAIKHQLHPIAIAEFWWGNSLNTEERKHRTYYPACRSKCKPILEYILEDTSLYNNAQKKQKREQPQ
jgi:tRNA pseudouridine32 synthase/23S rRNA pseudouridine746 synthase